jgi:hypothetical protein
LLVHRGLARERDDDRARSDARELVGQPRELIRSLPLDALAISPDASDG